MQKQQRATSKGRKNVDMFLWYANNVQRQKNTDMFYIFREKDAHKIRARTFNILQLKHNTLTLRLRLRLRLGLSLRLWRESKNNKKQTNGYEMHKSTTMIQQNLIQHLYIQIENICSFCKSMLLLLLPLLLVDVILHLRIRRSQLVAVHSTAHFKLSERQQ